MTPFIVRLAEAHEERAGRMLLPGAFNGRTPPVLLVAVTAASAQVVGAAALLPASNTRGRGRVLMVRVAKPFRRGGMGRALVEAAVLEAKTRGVKVLHPPDPVDAAGEEARAWRAMGFVTHSEANHYEAPIGDVMKVLSPLWERVEERGYCPPGARIVTLKEVSAHAVAQLHTAELGGTLRANLRRIRGNAPDSFHPDISYILMLDDKVVGTALGRDTEPGVGFLDAIVVIPALRGGWAQLMLKAHSCHRGVARGIHTVRFISEAKHRDTRKMAAKTGAKIIKTMVMLQREI